jgi:hypothetical protein
MGEGRNVYRVLVGNPERKRPLERPRRRWEDRIQNGPEGDWLGVWSEFTSVRRGTFGGYCECGDEPSGSGATELVSHPFNTNAILFAAQFELNFCRNVKKIYNSVRRG